MDLFLTFSNVTSLMVAAKCAEMAMPKGFVFQTLDSCKISWHAREIILKAAAAAAAKYSPPSKDDFTALTSLPALKCASQIAPYTTSLQIFIVQTDSPSS